jgi:hypothetical protein
LSNKKDLTRIEDLGEFLHELTQETEFTSDEDEPSELPDLPATESTDFDFGGSEETDFSSDFTSDTETASEDVTFDTNDFTSSFEVSSEEPITETESTDSWNPDEFSVDPGPVTDFTPETEPIIEPAYTPSQDFKTPETFEDFSWSSVIALYLASKALT